MDQDETWHGGRLRRLGPCHIVLDGTKISLKGHSPLFPAYVYCGQKAGCIRIPYGTEVGFGPGDIVLNGDSTSHPKKGTYPNFRPMSIVAKQLDA